LRCTQSRVYFRPFLPYSLHSTRNLSRIQQTLAVPLDGDNGDESESLFALNHNFTAKQEYEPAAFFDPYHLSIDDFGILSPYYRNQQPAEHTQTTSEMPPSIVFGFINAYHTPSANPPHDGPSSSPGDKGHSSQIVTSSLRYTAAPPLSETREPQDVVQVTNLPSSSIYGVNETVLQQQEQACDPRIVNNIQEDFNNVDTTATPSKRSRVISASREVSSSGDEQSIGDDGTYCDSEESEDEEDDDDEFTLKPNIVQTRTKGRRATTSCGSGLLSITPHPDTASTELSLSPIRRSRGLTNPVPVPNLTKKSRGRRVPTASSVTLHGGVEKNTRTYMCLVEGCGKCFARGEHLKRHVRSIHTNEKREFIGICLF
jgi:hypothetical protein